MSLDCADRIQELIEQVETAGGRIDELLAACNRELERRRSAEAEAEQLRCDAILWRFIQKAHSNAGESVPSALRRAGESGLPLIVLPENPCSGTAVERRQSLSLWNRKQKRRRRRDDKRAGGLDGGI